jgi:hypothetical protein
MAKKSDVKIAVQFGGVSIGEETARLGIRISRADVSLENADAMLCGRRITGRVRVAITNESPDQQGLPGMDDAITEIAAVFDVRRLGVSPKEFTAGLTFSLAEIDVSVLAHFAKREGWLIAEKVLVLDEVEKDA